MTVIAYSAQDSQVYGFLLYPELSTSVTFNFVDALDADITSLNILNPTVTYNIFGTLIPFLEVTSSLDPLPFVSRPETAYKLGSFSWVKAYTKVDLPNSAFRLDPICYASEYLVYPTQALPESKIILPYPNSSVDDYVVDFRDNQGGNNSERVIDTRTIDSGYGVSAKTAIGAAINIPSFVVLNLKIFYSLRIVGVGITEEIGLYQPIYI